MAYTPTTWVAGTTLVSAANLNNIEQGIKTADANATTAITNAATAQATADTAVTNAATAQAKADAALPATGGTVAGNLEVSGTLTNAGVSVPNLVPALTSETDFNAIITPGVYSTFGKAMLNAPTTLSPCYGLLIVTKYSPTLARYNQLYYEGHDGSKKWFTRRYNTSGWSSWEELGLGEVGTIATAEGTASVLKNTVTPICSVTLDAGVWMITGEEYDTDTYSKTFRLGINTSNSELLDAPSNDGATNSFGAYNTYMFKDKQVTAIVSGTAAKTYYLLASATAAPAAGVSASGYIRAVRIA